MANKTVVLAIFADEVSADAAAASLKDSGVAHKDAIGVLVLDDRGELKAEKVGKRSWGKGAGIGAVVALCTPVGLAAGLIGGGLLGALHHKNLGLDQTDRDRIGSELAGGKAAVGVLAPVSEARSWRTSSPIWAVPRRLILSPTRLSRKPRRPPPQTGPSLRVRGRRPCRVEVAQDPRTASSRRLTVPDEASGQIDSVRDAASLSLP